MSFALSAIIVGIGLIIAKGSGLIRDVIVSLRFSQGIYRDAYTLAFNIPDLFYNLLVGGAIYSTIAPYMSAQLAVGREEEGIKTVSKFITVVCIVMVICCTIGTVFSEPLYVIYGLFNDVKNPDTIPLAAQASKLLFPPSTNSFKVWADCSKVILLFLNKIDILSLRESGPFIFSS